MTGVPIAGVQIGHVQHTGRPIARVLSIAGTDPTGGAGIQADLKSIAANGGYGMAVVTALVAQNTRGVRSVHVPPVAFLREQLLAVSDDVQIDAVKIGMLAGASVIRTVSDWLAEVTPPVVVLDPVMVATSGDRLLDEDAEHALRELMRQVHLVTPNIPELAILAGEPVATTWPEVLAQARRVSKDAGVLVLAKGGHLDGEHAPDALVDGDNATEFPGARINTTNTHGTGCSYSSAIATRVATQWAIRRDPSDAEAGVESSTRSAAVSGAALIDVPGAVLADWVEAVTASKSWLTESITHADSLHVGSGNGPIHHFAGLWARGGVETSPTASQVATMWWEQIRNIRTETDALPFVRALGDGSLPQDAFVWYLGQDALYLSEYARLLAEASRLAPTAAEQAFWAASAQGAIESEMALHLSWIGEDGMMGVEPSATTTAYLNHLLAAGARGNYAVLIAALLPCFWMYQDVGKRLHPLSTETHPYRSWLDMYADEAFALSTERAIAIVTAVAGRADSSTREAMGRAFYASAQHERAFFAAPLDGTRAAGGDSTPSLTGDSRKRQASF